MATAWITATPTVRLRSEITVAMLFSCGQHF